MKVVIPLVIGISLSAEEGLVWFAITIPQDDTLLPPSLTTWFDEFVAAWSVIPEKSVPISTVGTDAPKVVKFWVVAIMLEPDVVEYPTFTR